MARQYVVTEEEMLSLVEGLELEKMRAEGHFRNTDITRQEIQDMHRRFHFVAVRWVQSMGFQGYRK